MMIPAATVATNSQRLMRYAAGSCVRSTQTIARHQSPQPSTPAKGATTRARTTVLQPARGAVEDDPRAQASEVPRAPGPDGGRGLVGRARVERERAVDGAEDGEE